MVTLVPVMQSQSKWRTSREEDVVPVNVGTSDAVAEQMMHKQRREYEGCIETLTFADPALDGHAPTRNPANLGPIALSAELSKVIGKRHLWVPFLAPV